MHLPRVLIAGDEVVVALKDRLPALGFQIAGVVSSRQAALKMVDECRADVVIMDMRLVLSDMHTSRQSDPYFSVPLVLLTMEDARSMRFNVVSASGVMVKPIDDRDLKTTLNMALGTQSRYSEVQRQAEERLKESEERYRKLVELSPDAVFVNCEGRIVFINSAGLKLLGAVTPDQVLNRPVVDFLHPESQASAVEMFANILEGRVATVPAVEERLVRLDRTIVETDVCASAFNHEGKPAVLVILRDITSRKMMEARFLRDQRIETIGGLASGIAHDLNNVLAPIIMTVALLRDKTDDPDTLALISAMETSAHRGAGIIQQLLTFGRGATGQRTLVQPKHLLKEISSLAHETFPRSIEVVSQCRSSEWLVMGNATQLHQVLLNLCINARDAMSSGGQLTVTLDAVNLDERIARQTVGAKAGRYVVFSVQDTGKGVPEELRERIFEPFFTTKEVGKGTGLGLATCLNLVKKHDGFMEFTSAVGRGTCFKVYLPAVTTAASVETTVKQTSRHPSGNGETILVVDDEEGIRKIMRATLEANGYQVLTANDGMEAVAVFKANSSRIKGVLMDVMMPVMGGPAAMRELRAIDPNVQIIATSGMIPKDLEAELAEQKPRSFLAKPFTTGQLLEALHSALRRES